MIKTNRARSCLFHSACGTCFRAGVSCTADIGIVPVRKRYQNEYPSLDDLLNRCTVVFGHTNYAHTQRAQLDNAVF